MYFCNECKEQFEEPRLMSDTHYEVDTRTDEVYSVCPYCASSDYEEMVSCLCCGEPIRSSEDYCTGCIDFANEAINEFSWKMAAFENANKLLLHVLESEG